MNRAERLHADLERGFAALDDGDLAAAAAIAERCRRIDRKHPEVIALTAHVADAEGDIDAALAGFRTLVEAAPDDASPRIHIARLELHDLGDPDAALATLEPAFDFIDEEADLIAAIMLKSGALIARGELVAARAALGELASSPIDIHSDGELAFELAELALAADDFAAAKRWSDPAWAWANYATDPRAADALHTLGRIHEAEGDRGEMVRAWQAVRIADLAAPADELAISDDELERIVVTTLGELPEHIRHHLERVPILIDDVPSEHVVEDGFDPRSLGLFQGTPLPAEGGAPDVTHILIYKKNLERFARDAEHLRQEIRITVLHETAHYFGLDDDDLEKLGLD